jgi:transposase
MMGPKQEAQWAVFYEFSLADHVPPDQLLRSIDRFVDLAGIRARIAPYYSSIGRPSIDPELMIRMLIIGYTHGIRSERRLCEEVHLNLAYRWFCRLDLTDPVPDHSTFSKNRHGRFRDSDLFRKVFEGVVTRCIAEGVVGGERFAADASLIQADANKQNSTAKEDWDLDDINPETAPRAVREYLFALDDAAFGAATEVVPKFTSQQPPRTSENSQSCSRCRQHPKRRDGDAHAIRTVTGNRLPAVPFSTELTLSQPTARPLGRSAHHRIGDARA